jgi:outer membrane protein assembly factor BamB
MSATPASCGAASNPAPVVALTVTSTSGQGLVEWQNPLSGPYGSTRVLYKSVTGSAACAFPSGASDASATVLTNQSGGGLGAHDSAVHGPVPDDNTTYCYSAFVNNGSGTFSAGRFVKGRPFDTSGSVLWAYSTGAASLAPPSVGSSTFAVSNDRILHSMSRGAVPGTWPSTWKPRPTNGPAQSRPPVVPTTIVPGSNEVVFIGAQDGYVYAVDAPTGVLRWQSAVRLGAMVQASPSGMFTAFGGAFDFILVGSRDSAADNAFYALDAATGAVVGSRFDNGGGAGAIGVISAAAAVDYAGRRVYFASRKRAGGSASTLWCLELTAGGLGGVCAGWTSPALDDIDGGPVLRSGRVYVGNNLGRVFAVDADTGAIIWGYDTFDGPVKSYVFPDRGSDRLYFATTNLVWGLSDRGASADLAWPSAVALGTATPSPVVFTPGRTYLYAGGSDGQLYQLDLRLASPTLAPSVTGVMLGDPSAVGVVGPPTLERFSQTLYVGTDAGVVYAVQSPLP